MKSPLIDNSKHSFRNSEFGFRAGAAPDFRNPQSAIRNPRSAALPWVYLLTLVAFAAVGSGLIHAGRTFNVESVAIQKQFKALSEQQVLSMKLKAIVTEHWFPGASKPYLEDQLQDSIERMQVIMGRLELLSESSELADFYAGDMKPYLQSLGTSWTAARSDLEQIPESASARELQSLQHTCDQLMLSGSELMQETLNAQHANQASRTSLLFIFAVSLALLGLIMLWALWSASNNRLEILALNLQLERRVAERTAELEKTNMFLSKVQSTIRSALVVVDANSRVLSWNPAAEKLWSIPQSEATGQDVAAVIPLQDAQQLESALHQVGQTFQSQSLRELGMKDSRGQYRVGNASLVPMLGSVGELRGVVILIDDVTERAQARRELASRADEIARTNQTLKRVNRDMEQFVYAASHDLRSPLVNMHGLVRKLDKCFEDIRKDLENGGAESPEGGTELQGLVGHDIPKLIFRLNRSITKFGSIIEGLLRYSRTGREEYHKVELDLSQEVAKVIELNAATIEEKGVQIFVDDLPSACGDPDAISKVLGNLIENALNYLDPDRDGEIVIEGQPPDEGMCMYFIRDNGVGIREEDLDRVFNIFERVGGTEQQGEGLGLAIVKKIVERHGGEIGVESHWGEGTTFWFTLPAVTGEAILENAQQRSSKVESIATALQADHLAD